LARSAAFTVTVNGRNFLAASVVSFGGRARPTTFVSATQLSAAIPADAIATAGTAPVTVTNPAPGGGVSNPVTFSITPPPMDPMESEYALSVTVDSLCPACATLPDDARHRTYAATIATRADGNVVVSLGGGRLLSGPICTLGPSGLDCHQCLASRASGTVQFSLLNENDEAHGGHIVEQIPQTGWMELIGNLTSPASNDMMSASGDGSLWFCSDVTRYPFPCAHSVGCAVHDLRMTFVRQ
jgi:hypothetical protein